LQVSSVSPDVESGKLADTQLEALVDEENQSFEERFV